MAQEMKRCSVCRVDKPTREFVTDRRSKDGRGSRCRECHRRISKQVRRGTYQSVSRTGVYPKKCPRCGVEKSEEEYPLDPSRKSGRHAYCRPCRSEDARERSAKRVADGTQSQYALKTAARRLGVSVEQVQEMNDEQEGRCPICGGLPTGNHSRLVLDHCHESGNFRGLICGHCNTGLGMFEDKPEVLRAAADYLERRKNGAQH